MEALRHQMEGVIRTRTSSTLVVFKLLTWSHFLINRTQNLLGAGASQLRTAVARAVRWPAPLDSSFLQWDVPRSCWLGLSGRRFRWKTAQRAGGQLLCFVSLSSYLESRGNAGSGAVALWPVDNSLCWVHPSPEVAVTKYHKLSWNNRHLLSHNSRGQTFEIKLSAGPYSLWRLWGSAVPCLSLSSDSTCSLWRSVVCSCPVSASVFTGPSPLCVSVSLILFLRGYQW